ncbi:MAG TPA: T9SS type A sorting domain-containing protein [Candidatus Acidoferrales bacterium]|nr:T9SS type A sorting domain-containing protein [Candidatus Acidoferrales bacterium]
MLITVSTLCLTNLSVAQWVETNGPYGASVCSFAADSTTIFAGTIEGGIYRSTDDGISWVSSNGAMVSTYALSLAAIGRNIFAGSGTGEGISVSTNDGITWRTVNNGLPPSPYGFQTGVIRALIVVGTHIFAGINDPNAVVYCSTDSGTSWNFAGSGITSGSISAFAIGPEGNDSIIAAGTNDGVFLSTDYGSTWEGAGLKSEPIRSLAFYGRNLFAASFYDGVFTTSDNGVTWLAADSGLSSTQASCLLSNGSELFLGTYNEGIFRYNNDLRTWSAVNVGLPPDETNALFFNGNSLFAGLMEVGVCRSSNYGAGWNVSNKGMREYDIYSLASLGNIIFASSYYSFRSSDEGLNWVPIMYRSAFFADMDTVVFATADSGICFSTDQGVSWTTSPNDSPPLGFQYTALAAGEENLYLGGAGMCDICNQGGVYLSTDRGGCWSYRGLANISALATSGAKVYAGDVANGAANVLVSTDAGLNWDAILSAPYYMKAIAVREGEIFIGTEGGGVIHSTDDGKNWEYIDTGLSGSALLVSSILVCGQNVFAGTGAGVFSLDIDDTSWNAINTGFVLSSDAVYALASGDSNLYAGLYGSVWERPFSQITAVKQAVPPAAPLFFRLGQNYPNPFNPTTIIDYQLPSRSYVTLKVYDVLGRQVEILVNEYQSAGSHSVRFDASKLPSGVYFYRLEAGTYHETKKLLLLK